MACFLGIAYGITVATMVIVISDVDAFIAAFHARKRAFLFLATTTCGLRFAAIATVLVAVKTTSLAFACALSAIHVVAAVNSRISAVFLIDLRISACALDLRITIGASRLAVAVHTNFIIAAFGRAIATVVAI